MKPEFVAAIRPLILGARENGWQHDVYPRHVRCDRWTINYDRGGFTVTDRHAGSMQTIRVRSTQQAIDVLVALGVLPVHFSSVYGVGHERGTEQALTVIAALVPDRLPDDTCKLPNSSVDVVPLPIGVEGHAIVGGRTR
jgi:hypothetical protein